MERNGYILAVDPDVEKSGFALLDCKSQTFVRLETLSFADAIRFFDDLSGNESITPLRIVIEDTDVSVNWHTDFYFKEMAKARFNIGICKMVLGKCAAVGRNTGLCHATYRHLMEYAEKRGFGSMLKAKKPLKKMWHGTDGKISHNELKVFVSGLPARTNQEMRDAALLAWDEAGFPIRISVRNIT